MIDKTVTIMVTMMTMIIQDLLESMTETDQDHHKAMSILAEKEEGESDTRATGAGKITRESQEETSDFRKQDRVRSSINKLLKQGESGGGFSTLKFVMEMLPGQRRY